MTIRTKALLGAAGTFALLGFAMPASAVVVVWGAPAATPGNWNDGANWVGGAVPASGDDSRINNGGTAVIDSSQNVQSLFVVMGTGAGDTGNLQMTGGTLTTTSDIRVGGYTAAGGGVGRFDQSAGVVNMSGGNLNVGMGSGGASGVYNLSGGSLQVSAGFVAAVGNRGTGTVNQTGGSLFVRSGTTPANGVIQLGRNATTTTGNGTYTLSGGTAAALALQFGNAVATPAGSVNTFNLTGNGRLITNNITVRNTNATNNFNFTGGTLNTANVDINLINSGGRLNPGGANFLDTPANIDALVVAPIGTLTFGGNNGYVQGPGGILEIDIDPAGNDFVSIGGAGDGGAQLSGTIAVNLLGGFDPALGQTFDVLAADTLSSAALATGLTPSGHMFVPGIETGTDGRQVLRLTVTPVPEPGVFPLGAAAALALSRGRLRKRKPTPHTLR